MPDVPGLHLQRVGRADLVSSVPFLRRTAYGRNVEDAYSFSLSSRAPPFLIAGDVAARQSYRHCVGSAVAMDGSSHLAPTRFIRGALRGSVSGSNVHAQRLGPGRSILIWRIPCRNWVTQLPVDV